MDSEKKKNCERKRMGKEGKERKGKKICNAMTCQFLLLY